jgi:hypothetical protein
MPWRLSSTYPFLFAIIPIVRLVAAYPGWVDLDDAAIVVAAALLVCGVVYGSALLITRGGARRLAPIMLFGLVLAFWGYVRAAAFVQRRVGLPHVALLLLWAAATAALIWWLARRPAHLDRAERFLTLTGGLLLGWLVLSIGIAEFRAVRALRSSAVVARATEPIRVRAGARVAPKRDIYLIILDEYANADVTGRLFGFDNHVFVDSLRQLGFLVPAVHSNYLHTFLSVPSLLNGAHVAGLADELGRGATDRTLLDHLVKHNRTVPFLKSQGYRYVFFANRSWEATQDDPRADVEVGVGSGFDLAKEALRSDFRGVLIKTSLLKFARLRTLDVRRADVRETLTGLARVPAMPGPVFAFAHIMSPHTPYIFDRNCAPTSPGVIARLPKEGGPAYIGQIECLNRLVLDMVTTVLRTSDVPPVIVLQGDHGSKSLLPYKSKSPDSITLAAAQERLGAFGAYYLPDHGHEAFGDSVTIVNVIGNVLRFYAGADLPHQPDDMYLSVHRAPLAFRRVGVDWLAGAHATAR